MQTDMQRLWFETFVQLVIFNAFICIVQNSIFVAFYSTAHFQSLTFFGRCYRKSNSVLCWRARSRSRDRLRTWSCNRKSWRTSQLYYCYERCRSRWVENQFISFKSTCVVVVLVNYQFLKHLTSVVATVQRFLIFLQLGTPKLYQKNL